MGHRRTEISKGGPEIGFFLEREDLSELMSKSQERLNSVVKNASELSYR